MAYVSDNGETKIFKLDLSARDAQPQPLVETIGYQSDLGVSADGSRIAFASNRTGAREIWVANADGSNQTQLTSFNGPAVGTPRWSPDGKTIAFDGYAGGSSDIYVVPADGGNPVRLTTDPSNEIRPAWSHDGKWIYYGSDRGGEFHIWKVPAAGGSPVQVTRDPGYNAYETPDGQWLYVYRDGGLYRMRPDGSGETLVRQHADPNIWIIGGHRVFTLDSPTSTLWASPFGQETFEKVYQFTPNNQPQGGGTAFALPADESYVILRRSTRVSRTLILIDNFR
jgi:Tol biopolymer transport system component